MTTVTTNLETYNPSVNYLRGIGPALQKVFLANKINTLSDLLLHLPDYYIDPSQVQFLETVHAAGGKGMVTVTSTPVPSVNLIGRVVYAGESFATKSGVTWFEVHLGHRGQVLLKLFWKTYQRAAFENSLRLNDWVLVAGALQTDTAVWQMHEPHLITLGADYPKMPVDKKLSTHYPPVIGLGSNALRKIIQQQVLENAQRLDYLLDKTRLADANLPAPSRALFALHLDWPCGEIHNLNARTSKWHQSLERLHP